MRKLILERRYEDNMGRMVYKDHTNNRYLKDPSLNRRINNSNDLYTFGKDGEPESPLKPDIPFLFVEE